MQRWPSRTWEELRISSFTGRVNSIRKIKLGWGGLTNLHCSRPAGIDRRCGRPVTSQMTPNSSGSHQGPPPTPRHLSRRNMMIISPRLLLKFESYRAKLPGKEMEINLGGHDAALSDENGSTSLFYGDSRRRTARRDDEQRSVRPPPPVGSGAALGVAVGDGGRAPSAGRVCHGGMADQRRSRGCLRRVLERLGSFCRGTIHPRRVSFRGIFSIKQTIA